MEEAKLMQIRKFCCSLGSFFPLLGACGRSGMRLGPALSLFEADAPGTPLRPYRPLEGCSPSSPAWDPWSRSIFFRAGHAVYRLTSAELVELVAGDPEEEGDPESEDEDEEAAAGAGPANEDVRMGSPSRLTSDGQGSIYCSSSVEGAGECLMLRVQLPAAWQVPAAEPAAGGAAAAGGGLQRVRVSRLVTLEDHAWELAYSQSAGSLIMGSNSALYRLPLGPGGGAEPAPVLLAGRRSQEGLRDGQGDRARFSEVAGIAPDGDAGGLVVLDRRSGNGGFVSAVRRVTLDGTVTTLASGLAGHLHTPFVLPNGYLAICDGRTQSLMVLDLGLKPLPLLPAPAAAAFAPPRRTLHADMGALLDAQPDGTADLTLVVAGRRFPAHRAILIARCDYFGQRLEGGFADGTAAELSLPDADPAAFELLLRWVYRGAVDIPPSLAPAVAELADRLLLPELCADAQAVVLSGVSAAGVVGSLLWAERLGPSFSGLQSSLKAWAVEHYEEVRGGGSLRRLMAEGPGLMEGLTDALAKRRRTQ
ncbi:hypothetical protein HYH03_018752 [Edaphochlamys debaryana]|uniref:BTB domain-containing protein n=1 Tax=Edaphochlamys debaryana TaxID=47281 RepID=A0A835XFE2_9CHLO|nr:hypothetical protein HYH03_018752 [Edaphochlamys debaryana]|eukprot:KAG2482310.1 hypothetical protein HYH03_018752 [Edaphochlamys debaryana]